MIINVYNIKQSWIFTQENKPSKQLFQTILSNSTKSQCNAKFIEHPTSFTIKIRLSDADVFSYNWNLISLNDEVFYTVQNVEILQEQQKSTSCTILCYEEELPYLAPHDLICVGKRDDLATQAKRLFAALREADRGSTTVIYAHLPVAEGLGLALYNRMIRAAAHTVKHLD